MLCLCSLSLSLSLYIYIYIYICGCMWLILHVDWIELNLVSGESTHAHKNYICIYIYICVCVCVCACVKHWNNFSGNNTVLFCPMRHITHDCIKLATTSTDESSRVLIHGLRFSVPYYTRLKLIYKRVYVCIWPARETILLTNIFIISTDTH